MGQQPGGDERQANIEELITAATEFEEETGSRALADFLATSALATDLDRWDTSQGAVSLMTLHAAKGLEFPVVYIVAVEENILPHARASESREQLEEERRLLFVGITRAQEELYLSYARERSFRGMVSATVPSQFLTELALPVVDRGGSLYESDGWRYRSQALDWLHQSTRSSGRRRSGGGKRNKSKKRGSVAKAESAAGAEQDSGALTLGTRVRHARYGVGYVVAISGQGKLRRVEVSFTRHGKRTFLASKAKLEILP